MIYCNTEDEGERVRDDGLAGPSFEPGRKGVSGERKGERGAAAESASRVLFAVGDSDVELRCGWWVEGNIKGCD